MHWQKGTLEVWSGLAKPQVDHAASGHKMAQNDDVSCLLERTPLGDVAERLGTTYLDEVRLIAVEEIVGCVRHQYP